MLIFHASIDAFFRVSYSKNDTVVWEILRLRDSQFAFIFRGGIEKALSFGCNFEIVSMLK